MITDCFFLKFIWLIFVKDPIDRPRRDCRPGKYQQYPWTQQGPTTILPKKRGAKAKLKKSTANIPRFNLEELPVDDYDDVMLIGTSASSPLIVHNVDPTKVLLKMFLIY